MDMQIDYFNDLVVNLRKRGYNIAVDYECGYRFAKITGKSIKGGFCDTYEDSPYLNGKIAFDNKDCFDKWSKCPYSLPIPQNEAELAYLLSKMEYLATKEGYEASDGYAIQIEYNYPRSVKKKWQM